MSDTEFITQEPYPFAVFPSLRFTCETGYIVRLWFIGRQYEQSPLRSQIPSFRLFNNLTQSFNGGLQLIPETWVVDRRSERRILASVMPMRFNFTMGDFIGIMDPREGSDSLRPSMLYHNNSGPSIYLQEGMTSSFLESSMTLKSNDYPLLAVETGKSHLCQYSLAEFVVIIILFLFRTCKLYEWISQSRYPKKFAKSGYYGLPRTWLVHHSTNITQ